MEAATRDAYGEALVEIGEDERIVVLDADLSSSTRTKKFAGKFPERFFNIGISEADMVDIAAGLSLAGKIPFVSSFAVFLVDKGYDQLRNTIARGNMDVKVVVSHAGFSVGEDGASHQTFEDVALMRVLPNFRVIVPADYFEAKAAIKKIAFEKGPFYVRLSRPKTQTVYESEPKFEIGRADVLREGKDVAIFACGLMVGRALRAAEKLEEKGIDAEVVNVSTIKPLDEKTILKSAKKCGKVVTVEEASVIGGLGGAVSEFLSSAYPVPIKRMGINDIFGTSANWKEVLKWAGLGEENIVKIISTFVIS